MVISVMERVTQRFPFEDGAARLHSALDISDSGTSGSFDCHAITQFSTRFFENNDGLRIGRKPIGQVGGRERETEKLCCQPCGQTTAYASIEAKEKATIRKLFPHAFNCVVCVCACAVARSH